MRYARMALAAPAVLALACATAATAQSRLPLRTPAERQVEDINRSLTRQQHDLRQNQQNQFEINSLRNDLQRNYQSPTVTGPGRSIGCPPGSIGC